MDKGKGALHRPTAHSCHHLSGTKPPQPQVHLRRHSSVSRKHHRGDNIKVSPLTCIYPIALNMKFPSIISSEQFEGKLDLSFTRHSWGIALVCIRTKRCVSSHFHQQLSSYVLLPSPSTSHPLLYACALCGVRNSGAEADTQTVRYDVLLVTSNPCANVIHCYCVSLTSLWCISMQCRGEEIEISIYSSFFFLTILYLNRCYRYPGFPLCSPAS